MRVLLSLVLLIGLSSCQEEKQSMDVTKNSLSAVSGSAQVAGDDFSDLKKEKDEGCKDKTAEDIEKELAKKAAEMKKAAEEGKATGFNFNAGEPGCDPNAEQVKH